MSRIKTEQFQKQYEMMNEWISGMLDGIGDENLKTELSPGKNHGIWILGHIISSDDDFSRFLGEGDLLYPDLFELFKQGSKLQSPESYPSVSELKKCREKVIEKNMKIYSKLTDEDLSKPHALVKDYEKDYMKTKERVLMVWQFHLMYHNGQLSVIQSKCSKV